MTLLVDMLKKNPGGIVEKKVLKILAGNEGKMYIWEWKTG